MEATAAEADMGIVQEIAAYDAQRNQLEASYTGKWVIFYGGRFIGVYDSFDDAATDAVVRFGRGPYLIRQVGAQEVTLPTSYLWAPIVA